MSARNPVYISQNGRFVSVTTRVAKDVLLFATSRKKLSDINRNKRMKLQEGSDMILERIKKATARES